MQSKIKRTVVVLALLAACEKGSSPAPRKVAPAPATPPAVAVDETRDSLSLAERLLKEASEHPEALQDVQDKLRQIEQAGVTLTRTRQALARPLAAQYCATALTAAGLGLSICGFNDVEGALRGRERSHASFDRLIPGRTLLVNGTSLLTLVKTTSEQAQKEAERIRVAFMKPRGSERAAL